MQLPKVDHPRENEGFKCLRELQQEGAQRLPNAESSVFKVQLKEVLRTGEKVPFFNLDAKCH